LKSKIKPVVMRAVVNR